MSTPQLSRCGRLARLGMLAAAAFTTLVLVGGQLLLAEGYAADALLATRQAAPVLLAAATAPQP